MFDWVLLQETPLPQIPCDWNTGFSIKDFSLVSWMKNINLPSGQQLSKIMASKLLEHLGIGSLMEETSCQRSGPMYSPATDGWKKDCPLTIPLTPLTIPATCMIPSHCTAVDCCLDVDFLGRSFHAYLDLDTCNNKFTVGIEKLKLDPVSLVDYKFDCKHDLVLPKLPDSTRCSIGESCTAVSCCMNVDFLKRAFNTRVKVDTCNYKLKFGIEKLDQEIDLFNYKWGTVEKKYLLGVVRIDFIVNDLVDDKQFQVTLNLSLCFEDGQPCLLTMNVLKDAKLPKLFCDWGTGFLVPDFSLKNFLESQGGKLVEFLPTTVSSLLMKTLGIDKFLLSTPCLKSSASSIQVQVNFSSSGQQLQIPRSPWYACPGIQSNPVVPSLVSCSVPSTYSAIDCCIDVKLIGRTINARISLDPCTYKIEIGIEKLKIKKSLLNYKWGGKETFTLQGGVKLQYRIDDLASEKMFMLDLSLYVCMEESRPSDCVVDIPILKNLNMPKPLCNCDGGFTVPKFSLNSWLSNNGIPNTAKLGQYVAQQIIRELGIDEYLNVPQCDRKTPPYSPSNTQGWNISPECPTLANLPHLPTSMSCHITDNCTRLDCCVDVDKLGLSLNAYIVLDTCSNKFTVGVDKFSRTISLLNVDFGKLEVFSFLGLFKIGYKIDYFQSEKTFVVSVNVNVCMESNKPCDVHLEVIKNVKFPKPL